MNVRFARSQKRFSHLSVFAVSLVATLCTLGQHELYAQDGAGQYRYAITRIPGLGGGLDFPFAVNDQGIVVGESLIPDNSAFHPFVWNGASTIDLGTFGGRNGTALDINNAGWVVGGADRPATNRSLAFLWKGEGQLIALTELSGSTSSAARAVNENGRVVGISDMPEATIGHAVLWEDENTIIDLGTLGGPQLDSDAYDINESGFVTGWSGMNMGGRLAFLWDGQEMTHIGSLGNGTQRTEPQAINESNIIVALGEVDNQNVPHPAIYVKGTWYDLMDVAPPGFYEVGRAWDISDDGQVVGDVEHTVSQVHYAFAWQYKTGMHLLNELIPPNTDWHLYIARGMNERGQILVGANPIPNPENFSRALLLTPVEPEMTIKQPYGSLRAGKVNTFTIDNAQPGATIKFFYGRKGGGMRIPGCDALAAMLQIDDPTKFGEVTADAAGHAELRVFVPKKALNFGEVLVQAVDFDHCEESELVLKQVE